MGRYKPYFKQDQYRNKILFTLYSNVYEKNTGKFHRWVLYQAA